MFSDSFALFKEEMKDADYNECYSDYSEVIKVMTLLEFGIADITHYG